MISPLRDLEYENHPFIASSIHRDVNVRPHGASSMYSTYDLEINDD